MSCVAGLAWCARGLCVFSYVLLACACGCMCESREILCVCGRRRDTGCLRDCVYLCVGVYVWLTSGMLTALWQGLDSPREKCFQLKTFRLRVNSWLPLVVQSVTAGEIYLVSDLTSNIYVRPTGWLNTPNKQKMDQKWMFGEVLTAEHCVVYH